MLAKHPDEYRIRRRCKGCGRFETLRIDKWADTRQWRKQTCYCDGWWFPHRHGSRGCNHYEQPIPWDEPGELYYGDEAPF